MAIDATTYQAKQTEAQFQAAVVQLAETLGWRCWHFPQARGNPCVPDLFLFRDGVLVLAELKTERGKLSVNQARMILDLDAHGIIVHVWRPSSWPEIERVLQGGP